MEGTCVECGKVGSLARRDLCGACYQRHWKAGTLPSIPKAATAPRIARECEHPGHPHRHGTRVAYVLDRCRCEPCTAANRDGMKALRQQRAVAQWNPDADPFVPGDALRAHLRELMAAGMGWKRIARAAGVGCSTVYPILYGKWANDPLHPEHRPPRKQVRRDIAEKLLAVTLDLADGALVNGTGTRRRLQALIVVGWPQSELASRIGWSPSNIGKLIHSRCDVAKATADHVRALYEDLWDAAPPEPGSRYAAAGRVQARRSAVERGWVPPMAWDDDTIDDPRALPSGVNREEITAARIVRVEQMLAAGRSRPAITRRIGVAGGDVRRMLARAGRDDLVERWDAIRNNAFVRTPKRSAAA